MKRTFAIMLLTATMATGQLLAQEQAAPKQSHNSVYLEFGGNAPTWNIAYDRGIYNKDIRKTSVAMGFEFIPKFTNTGKKYYSLSPQVYYLNGKKHRLEVGGGIVTGFQKKFYLLVIPSMGYRYQNFSKSDLFFKAAFTPVMIEKEMRMYLMESCTLMLECQLGIRSES